MSITQRIGCLAIARTRAATRGSAAARVLAHVLPRTLTHALAYVLRVAVLLCLSPALSYAQCVMCGKNAEYAGGEPGRAYATLATAALVLLVPMLSFVGGLAVYVWKHRH